MSEFDWRTVSATECDLPTLNRAVLMAAGKVEAAFAGSCVVVGDVVALTMWIAGDVTFHQTPVSNSDWAAGFCLDRLAEMNGILLPDWWILPDGAYGCRVKVGGKRQEFCPIDPTATGRGAMCECVCRAYVAWRQGQEAKPE